MSNGQINDQTLKAFANIEKGASAVNSVSSPSSQFFTSAGGNSRVKEGYNSCDYRSYRDHEALPNSDREMMQYGDDAYYKVGIVRNIVDLMSDFVVKGVKWEHSNKNVESFYNSWFRDTSGLEVSERFCSYLLRMGNVVIHPIEAKIQENVAKEWKKTRGEEFGNINYKASKIPSHYTFINPLTMTHVSKDLGNFIGKRIYQIQISSTIVNICNQFSLGRNINSNYGRYVSSIPKDMMKRIVENKGTIVFDEDEILVEHYRKDDWCDWARPMISCIFPQLVMLEKMHLADMSALDGAISNIRLWRLGFLDPTNINNSYIPSPEALGKVRDLIHNNVSGGVLDLIWGPELDFKESNTQVHNFLGPEKYTQVMNEIYDGLGVPPSLSGGSGGGSTGGGFTNNFISMKVLVDRLDYLRSKLKKFWTKEAKKIQKAMGFSSPAKISFDDAVVSDEGQHKKLLLDMWDRDLIDSETVLSHFNMYPKVVQSRIAKEMRKREKFKAPQKAGPYHNPMWLTQLHTDLIKMDKVDDEGLPFDIEDIELEDDSNENNTNPNGRPFGQKDQNKRKDKIVRPRTAAFVKIQNWARDAYDEIAEIVTPNFVAIKNKSNARQLTNEEQNELEDFKLSILNSMQPFSDIDKTSIANVLSSISDSKFCISMRNELLKQMSKTYKRKINIEDKRVAACASYALSSVK